MKKTARILSIAALVAMGIMGAACSKIERPEIETPETQKENIVTLTTTVGFAADDTKALTGTGVKTFAAGETMALVYKNTGGSTVQVVSTALTDADITGEGKSATFTFELTDPDKTKEVTYIYPAAMANDDGTVNYAALNSQDGTLASLAADLDYCTKSGAWNGDNLPSLTLENQLAILAITLKNADGSSDINNTITSMVVSDGTNSSTINRTPAAGPIYVAILPTSDATISVTATDGSKNYTKTLNSKTYAASNGYPVSWRMTEVAVRDLSMLDCAGNLRPRSWTANCYMAHTAGDYKLPLVYGNAIKNGATNAAAYTGVSGQLENFTNHAGSAIANPWIKNNGITVTSAELLWQDAEGLITNVGISGDYLTLTVGKNAAAQEGNAVVAAKDGEGTIVWSWHIWVTKQTFANLTSVNTGSHTYQLTPVNLGWVGDPVSQGYNTFYQWGRKDAFIPGTGTTNTNHTVYNISNAPVTGLTYSTSSATIADNIKNPTTFYKVSSKPNNSTAYNLWDAQQTGTGNIATATKKTVYDPCPAGFCVPTGNLWNYFGNNGSRTVSIWDSTNKGATWNTGITGDALWFPASGYRNSSGSLSVVGSQGDYWSASPNSGNSCRSLYFDSGNWTWSYYTRANGFPVRPVAEE